MWTKITTKVFVPAGSLDSGWSTMVIWTQRLKVRDAVRELMWQTEITRYRIVKIEQTVDNPPDDPFTMRTDY